MQHATDVEFAGCVDDDVGAETVRQDEVLGPVDRAVDVAFGGEMDHGVVALHRLGNCGGITDVALHEPEARVVVDVFQGGEVARVGQRVEDGHFVVGVVQDVAKVVGPDESGSTGDELLHEGCSVSVNAFRDEG